MTQTHRIDKLSFEIGLHMDHADTAVAHQISNRVSRTCSDELLPLIGEVMDRKVSADTILRLPQLVLDLGKLPLHNLEAVLRERLLIALEQELDQIVASDPTAERAAQPHSQAPEPTIPSVHPHWMTPLQSQALALIFFLTHGCLPWASQGVTLSFLVEHFLQVDDGDTFWPALKRTATQTLLRPSAQQRLVFQFDNASVVSLLKKLLPPTLQASPLLSSESPLYILESRLETHERISFFQQVFTRSLKGDAPGDVPRWEAQVLAAAQSITTAPAHLSPPLPSQIRSSMPQADAPPVTTALYQWLNQYLVQTSKASPHNPSPPLPQSSTVMDQGTQASSHQAFEEVGTSHPEADTRKESQEDVREQPISFHKEQQVEAVAVTRDEAVDEIPTEEPDSIEEKPTVWQVQNAGLVLLSPFLNHFFTELELKDGNTFPDDARIQAALSLQYVIQQDDYHPEHLLPLNKLLCGIPLDEPIEARLTITPRLQTCTEELMQAVITQWSALKNTSVDGLRESFLKRNGHFSFDYANKAWHLRVEQRAYDMLLNQLPWTFNMIHYSWMDFRLITDWEY